MNISQRIIFNATIVLLCSLVAISQTASLPTKGDDCPSAEIISNSYSTFEAKVIEVVNGNTLIVKSKDSKRKVINMVGIAAPDLKTPLGVLLSITSLQDVNLERIKAGMAQYRKFGAYTQDAKDWCLYEKAEAEAKIAKLGIWAR